MSITIKSLANWHLTLLSISRSKVPSQKTSLLFTTNLKNLIKKVKGPTFSNFGTLYVIVLCVKVAANNLQPGVFHVRQKNMRSTLYWVVCENKSCVSFVTRIQKKFGLREKTRTYASEFLFLAEILTMQDEAAVAGPSKDAFRNICVTRRKEKVKPK